MTDTRNKGNSIIGFPDEYVVLDLETTGLDPSRDEIIEIGAVRYKNGQRVGAFETLVKPSLYRVVDYQEGDSPLFYSFENGKYVEYVNSFITMLTGITNAMLKDAPSQEEAVGKLMEFIGDAVIVGHNVNFDINFVYDAYLYYYDKEFKNDFIDTMRIARKILRQLEHHRLCDICEQYNIDYSSAHRATEDCLLTNECFMQLKQDVLKLYSSEDEFISEFKKSNHGGRKLSVKDIKPEEGYTDEDSLIFGKEVVITGTLEKMLRKDALQLVANIGGIPSNNVNKHTNYLVIANKEYDQQTDKKKKAHDLILKGCDLQIISEDVFYTIIGLGEDSEESPSSNNMSLPLPETKEIENLVKEMLGDEYKKNYAVSELTQKRKIIGYSFSIFSRVVFRIKTNLKESYRIELFNFQDSSKDIMDLIKTTAAVKELEDRTIIVDLKKNAIELKDFISTNEDAIKEKMFDIYINFSPVESFGCCHSYEKCSDARKCILVESNPILARGCTYRKNLESNRIFYGANKNV